MTKAIQAHVANFKKQGYGIVVDSQAAGGCMYVPAEWLQYPPELFNVLVAIQDYNMAVEKPSRSRWHAAGVPVPSLDSWLVDVLDPGLTLQEILKLKRKALKVV